MTTLSSLNVSLPPTVTTVTPVSNTGSSLSSTASAAAKDAITGSGSTIVTIPSASGESPILYTQQGILAGAESTVTWAHSSNDAVSLAMAGDYLSGTMSGQFYNLGSALLDRFKTTDSNFSQSVTVASAGATSALGGSGQGPQGEIKLTVVTASGVKVEIDMDSEDGTLAVNMKSSGTLSPAERSALAKLSGGFQHAIDGLNAYPPKLDLTDLSQYDTSVLSSVNMQVNVTGDGEHNLSANISLNGSARSVSVTDPDGTINLKVDTSNSAIWGSGKQREQAIASYLAQFDNASTKGHGNAELMSMFKDAFTPLNSDYGTSSQQLPGTAYVPWLAQSDHAMLTGLADFTGSVTDIRVSSNPLQENQTDSFSYQVSQSTRTQGDLQNGTIAQTQQSHLQASYHEGLSGGPVHLGNTLASQNYKYFQVDDDASSTVNIASQRNELRQTSLNQSSSQSTRQSEYQQGVLVSDTTTPTSTSSSKDLLKLLQPLVSDNEAAENTGAWQQALSGVHAMVLLNAS